MPVRACDRKFKPLVLVEIQTAADRGNKMAEAFG
jgi:hypothetical protein